MLLELTDQTFEAEVLQSKKPVLVSFASAKCGPCKALHPILDKLAEINSKVKFARLDVAAYPVIANKYKVSALPTVLLFHAGIINQFVGKPTQSELIRFLAIV